jgi:tetratricopeptide (TPR) repeat protein
MLDEATALDWLYKWQRSRALAEAARDLVADRPDPLLQARVLMALGRSLHRFNSDREAAPVLRQAVQMAQVAGDAAYEDHVAAELLLGFLLPFIGLSDEAEQRLQDAERLCQRKGDELHLAGMLNNRSCLWVARNDRQRFLEDCARVLEYARRMGNMNLERNVNYNSACFLYWRAEHQAALPFARRAIEIDERYFRQASFRPDAAVLLTRISWSLGDREATRKLVEEVRVHQAAARAENKLDSLLPPNDVMLLDMSALLVEDGSARDWEALVIRAREVAQGQELIEVLEYAGLAALERGDRPAAARWWQEALAVNIPNIFADRIAERLQALGS